MTSDYFLTAYDRMISGLPNLLLDPSNLKGDNRRDLREELRHLLLHRLDFKPGFLQKRKQTEEVEKLDRKLLMMRADIIQSLAVDVNHYLGFSSTK